MIGVTLAGHKHWQASQYSVQVPACPPTPKGDGVLRGLFFGLAHMKRQAKPAATWHDYEYAKQQWIARNPGATPEQYQQAIAAIARRLGV